MQPIKFWSSIQNEELQFKNEIKIREGIDETDCILSLIKPILKSVVVSLILESDKKLLLHGWRKMKIQVKWGGAWERRREKEKEKESWKLYSKILSLGYKSSAHFSLHPLQNKNA